MIKKIAINLMLLSLVSVTIFSCKKKKNEEVSPQFSSNVCPLVSVNDDKGANIRAYEYVQGKLIRIFSKDSIPTTLEFRYNAKKQIERMNVLTTGNSQSFEINYTYDEKGNVSRTTAKVAGIEFMENIFTLKDEKISSIKTTVNLFGRSVEGNTRIEYVGNNVSKVFARVDKDPETLAFVGEKYDDKPQFNPTEYKIAALGFVGIANNFFSFFGKNNLIQGRIYDEKGLIDQKMNISFVYNESGLPLTSDSQIEKNGKMMNQSISYQFDCP